MDDILAARSQMAFQIIFAVVGIGLPLLMRFAECRPLRSGDKVYLTLETDRREIQEDFRRRA